MLHIVRYGEKYGAVNTSGQVVIPFSFALLCVDEPGRVAFQRERTGLVGYFDETGAITIAEQFASGFGSRESASSVCLEGFKGCTLIDRDGKPLFDKVFKWVRGPSNGHALADEHGLSGIINLKC